MKTLATVIVVATALLAAGCTVQITGSSAKGRLVISAQEASAGKSVASAKALATSPLTPTALQSYGRSAGRAISASTDVQSMTYTIKNVGGKEATQTGPLDPTDPDFAIYLTPGQTYRVSVDVVPTANAPGAKVGVLRYGDEVEVTMPTDGSWMYAILNVRPTLTYAFHNAGLGTSGSSKTVIAWNPLAGTASAVGSFNFSPQSDPEDQFFYGADGRLYYFNTTNQLVHLWNDLSTPLVSATTKVIDGANLTDLGTQTTRAVALSAICADPYSPGFFWAVGSESSGTVWRYYWLYGDIQASAGYIVASSDSLNAAFNPFSSGSTTVHATSIAVSSTYNIYIGSYAANYYSASYHGASSVTAYPFGESSAAAIYPTNPVFSGASTSVVRDVSFAAGRVWAAVSPLRAEFETPSNIGRADLWCLDESLLPTKAIPSSLARYYADLMAIGAAPAASLYFPTRFAGGIKDGNVFLTQVNAYTPNYEDVSQVNVEASTVTSRSVYDIYAP